MPDFLKTKFVNVRKEHTCFGCGEKIVRGSIARVDTFVEDGIYDLYHCERCIKLEKEIKKDDKLSKLWDNYFYPDGVDQNDLIEFARDYNIKVEELS